MRRGRGGEGGEEANKLCEPDPVQGSGFRVQGSGLGFRQTNCVSQNRLGFRF